jgi:hypothetical protein
MKKGPPRKQHGNTRKPAHTQDPTLTHVDTLEQTRATLRSQRRQIIELWDPQIEAALKDGDAQLAAKYLAGKEMMLQQHNRTQLRAICMDTMPEAAAQARKGKYRLLATIADILIRTNFEAPKL